MASKRKYITKADVAKLTRVGSQMACTMFNLSQMPERVPYDGDREKMAAMFKEWDAVRNETKL